MHVYVPLNSPDATFASTKRLVRTIAAGLASSHPTLVVDVASRPARAGRVFVDWAQNNAARSMVAPYSIRARRAPHVSMPVTWDEVEAAVKAADSEPLAFTPAQTLDRINRVGDLSSRY